MLKQVLEPEARARCTLGWRTSEMPALDDQSPLTLPPRTLPPYNAAVSRIGMVKPEKARQLEDQLIQAARSRQLSSKVVRSRLLGGWAEKNNQTSSLNSPSPPVRATRR